MDPAVRLHELLGYIEQVVKLDERPAMRLSDHRLANGKTYVFHQHEFHALPGVSHDTSDEDGPIWLAVERLKRSEPPVPNAEILDWVEVPTDPDKAPVLREFVLRTVSKDEKDVLIAAGKVRREDCEPSLVAGEDGKFDVRFRIEDNPKVVAGFDSYLSERWLPWASKERPRRCSISLYQKLFELVQLVELGSADQAIELVWGIGLSRWVKDATVVDLPLLERLVELEMDEATGGTIRVRPRQAPAHANLRPYEELKLEGLSIALDGVRRALASAEEDEGVSPYRRDSFELILRGCQTRLDPEGRYLPDVSKDDPGSAVPDPARQLTVSDRWVIFARKRSENFILRDIENLKASVERQKDDLPGPAKTLVMGPEGQPEQAWAPLSNSLGAPITPELESGMEPPLGDLFFPKPFNQEQVEIVKRLDRAEGVVVQGPPGTGKTHTIANIICHYLATGRRVLVVSHGEAALAVLRDKLPDAVRDLAISITTSEKEGLRQVEGAIRVLQSVVQGIRAAAQARVIADIEQSIIRMRDRLKAIDGEIDSIAQSQLSQVDGVGMRPAELAKRLLEARARCEWFPDRPEAFASKSGISDEMISALRKARASLGKRIANFEDRLPSIEDLPTGRVIAGLHQDLIRAAELTEIAASHEVKLRIDSLEGVEHAAKAADALDALLHCAVHFEAYDWLIQFSDPKRAAANPLRGPLETLLRDLDEIVSEHPDYIQKPVVVPAESYALTEFSIVVSKLAAGERAFGLFAFKERAVRPVVESVRVVGRPPAGAEDWEHVRRFMKWRVRVNEVQSRWAALAQEIRLSSAALDPKDMAQLATALRSILITVPEQLVLFERCLTRIAFGTREVPWPDTERMIKMRDSLRNAATAARLSAAREEVARIASLFSDSVGKLGPLAREFVLHVVGRNDLGAERIETTWNELLARIDDLKRHRDEFDTVRDVATAIAEAGAPHWAERLRTIPAVDGIDDVLLPNWRESWDWAAADRLLVGLDQRARLSALSDERRRLEETIGREFERLVRERTHYALAQSMTGPVRSALMMFATALRRIGKGTGAGAERHRREARQAMLACYGGVPCWIMPSWRVAEQLPGKLGSFDLVIMDEASQSDIRELPALLRGKKILVVGDDKQVSPTAAFIENAKIDRLERTFLSKQAFKTLLLPGSSLYDLAKVMFPNKFVMLREHFRCVEPIIQFSSQFYTEDLVPLRVPTGNERLDPPLVDILVTDGSRSGDKINHGEAQVIVSEIKRICNSPSLARVADENWRSIGVISLIGSKQAALINRMLLEELGEEMIVRHRIACGDSATFQGNERDIVFLSMVADRRSKQAQTATHFEQRFNVAMSRARDRVYLVRSVREEDLNPNDLKAKVIRHFNDPMPGKGAASSDLESKCESEFEREILRRLLQRQYRVRPQVGAAGYRIDLVVEGVGDRRLAIECDGDKYHGPERWADDMARQRVLERVGWRFWRCWASTFTLDPDGCMADLLATLDRMGIYPQGAEAGAEIYTEHRTVEASRSAKVRPAELPEGLRAGSGIQIGDRVIVRYLDDNKQLSFVLSEDQNDPTNGIVSTTSPLGSKLLGLNEEDEVEFEVNGKIRCAIIVRTERGEYALGASEGTPSPPIASSQVNNARRSGSLDVISA